MRRDGRMETMQDLGGDGMVDGTVDGSGWSGAYVSGWSGQSEWRR